MSKLKYSIAMLTAGGALGGVTAANAVVYTDTLNIPFDQPLTQITILGSTPQFDYGYAFGVTAFSTDYFGSNGVENSGVGLKTTTPGLPAPGETYDPTTKYLFQIEGDHDPDDEYVHLAFDYSGQEYVGVAHVSGGDNTLIDIQYEAVPEPAAWALLIGGLGLVGGALRASRRRQAALTA